MMRFDLDEAIYPEEAKSLQVATERAIRSVGAARDIDREGIADAVLAVARSGYARSLDGHFDDRALAEAAVIRFCCLPKAWF